MSKGLNSLYIMVAHLSGNYARSRESLEDFRNIEKELKEYELMKHIHFIVADKKISDDDLEKLKNQRIFASGLEESKVELLFDEETQKKLKALEIIKEKRVDVYYLMNCKTLEEYNDDVLASYAYDYDDAEQRMLTQEEYDLLKEVLS